MTTCQCEVPSPEPLGKTESGSNPEISAEPNGSDRLRPCRASRARTGFRREMHREIESVLTWRQASARSKFMSARRILDFGAINRFGAVLMFILVATLNPVATWGAEFNVKDVNPDTGQGDPILGGGRNTSSGGRANGLAIDPANPNVLYAASEWGGLWKTLDGGSNWFRLEDHKPFATWDVAVNPGNTGTVYATSFYDGRSETLAGISVSPDGGATWTKPSSTIPPSTQCSATRRAEATAFGLAVDPAAPSNVYAGTNCGLAISNDSGVTWTHVMPSGAPSRNIRDVVAHNNGTVDVCGDDGHYRSTDGGSTWTAGTGLPGGACSITVSPLNSDVLHATAANDLWETVDGGGTWTKLADLADNRPRWVVDGPADGASFTMYYGDGVKLRTVACDDSTTPCPAGGPGSDTDATGDAHDDPADIVFDDSGCPRYLASDGGVYRNSACPSGIDWDRSMGGYRALWAFGFDGGEPITGGQTSLHMGMQDNGYFSSDDAGTTWQGNECCDGFDNVSDDVRTVYSICCFTPAPTTRFFVADADNPQNNQSSFGVPPGNARGFAQLDSIDQFAPQSYIMTTSGGVFISTDEGGTWQQLGSITNACGVVTSTSSTGSVTFYAKTGSCNGGPGALLKYSGTATTGTWTPADNGLTSVGIFAVDPNDPNRLRAADLAATPRMVFSSDGGQTWQQDAVLDNLMTGGGEFKYVTQRGPTNFTGFNGYAQPTLLAFSPLNENIIFAGGTDSGLFATSDGGNTWVHLASDVPRPYHAFFSTVQGATYIGTQGRGVFEVTLANADLSISKSDSPDPVIAGEQLYYELTVENLGPDDAEEVLVQDRLPEEVSFITDDAGVCDETAPDELLCNFGDLVAGSSRSVTIKVKVDENILVDAGGVAATGITNTASVSGRVEDPDTSNNEVSESTIVEDAADLSLVKICKPDGLLDAGEVGFCEILVDNLGSSAARDVTITDQLESGTAPFSITSVSSAQSTCSPTSGSGSNSYTVTCEAASLDVGDRIKVTIEVTANETTDINDFASVTAATPDPSTANNSYEGSISVESVADLALNKTAPPSVIAGQQMTYSLDVNNNGPSDAVNVTVTDNLPAGTEVVTIPAYCTAGVPGDPFQPTVCDLGTISSGSMVSTDLTVSVLPDTRGTLINDATVSSATVDRENGNNSASASTAVESEADLEIIKSDVQDPVNAGETLDYELKIVNNGPSSALNVIVIDELPPEVDFADVVLQDVTGECALLDPPATNVMECHIGELQPNVTTPAFIKIKTKVRANTPPGQIENVASVESTDTLETNASDNIASESTTVMTLADLGVSKTTPLNTYKPSSQIIYTVSVVNPGPSDAQNVVVVDDLPLNPKKGEYLFDSGGCSYDESAHELTCTLGTLAAGGNVTFDIHINLKGNVGEISNVVDVSSSTADPDSSNNTFVLNNLVTGKTKEQKTKGRGASGESLLVTGMSIDSSCDMRDLEVEFSWLPDSASPRADQVVQVSLYPNQWNAAEFGVSHMPAHAQGDRARAIASGLSTGTVYYWRVAAQGAAGGTQRFETPYCVADFAEN